MVQPSKGLGRGLSALMGDNVAVATTTANADTQLPLSALRAGKYQPRQHFDATQLEELASSLKKHGLMQPLVVRAVADGNYEIIAGERRFRAAKLAGLESVAVIIREVNDTQALELALIENIQRADLNPLEEATGYQRLMDEFGYTQERLSPVVGKSRSHIANLVRLLKLPDSIKQKINTGELTMGHARALLVAENAEALAQEIITLGLSVRQAEERAKGKPLAVAATLDTVTPSPVGAASNRTRTPRMPVPKNEDVLQLESMLSNNLGLQVSIDAQSGQAGEVVISYHSLTQLDEILRRLGGGI